MLMPQLLTYNTFQNYTVSNKIETFAILKKMKSRTEPRAENKIIIPQKRHSKTSMNVENEMAFFGLAMRM